MSGRPAAPRRPRRAGGDEAPAQGGNVKATRAEWLAVAMDILVSDGVEQVKVLSIGERLGVSRSSFYWYFRSRKDLLDALLAEWDATNTGILVSHAAMPAATITEAVCNVFRGIVDPEGFDYRLDFAVREWARRDGSVRRVIDRADAARLDALSDMFARHGYDPEEAEIRARVLYFMQIGYYTLDLAEPLEERLRRVPGYLKSFTGVEPRPEELTAFEADARRRAGRG